jgi:hypothetical protein
MRLAPVIERTAKPPRVMKINRDKIEKNNDFVSPIFAVKLGYERQQKLKDAAALRGLSAAELIRRAIDAVIL